MFVFKSNPRLRILELRSTPPLTWPLLRSCGRQLRLRLWQLWQRQARSRPPARGRLARRARPAAAAAGPPATPLARRREPLPLRRHDVVGVRGDLPMADADRTLLARECRAFQAFKLLAYLNYTPRTPLPILNYLNQACVAGHTLVYEIPAEHLSHPTFTPCAHA